MRTLAILLGSLVSVVSVTASAQELKLTRPAESGVDSRLAYERSWDKNCKALPTQVTIRTKPAHGTVSVVQGTSTIPESTVRSGDTSACAGKTVTGNEVKYKSDAGFHGTDSVSYDVVYGNGRKGSTIITISVK